MGINLIVGEQFLIGVAPDTAKTRSLRRDCIALKSEVQLQ